MKNALTYAPRLDHSRTEGLRTGARIAEDWQAVREGSNVALLHRELAAFLRGRPTADEAEAFAQGLKDVLLARIPEVVARGAEPTGADGLARPFLDALTTGLAPPPGPGFAGSAAKQEWLALADAIASHLRCSLADEATYQQARVLAVGLAMPTTSSEVSLTDLMKTTQAFLSRTLHHLPLAEFTECCRAFRQTLLALAPDGSSAFVTHLAGTPCQGRDFSMPGVNAIARAANLQMEWPPGFRHAFASTLSGTSELLAAPCEVTPSPRRHARRSP